MKTMENMLVEEVKKLERIILQAKKRVETAPEGSLRISNKGQKMEYYYKYKGTSNLNGKYIKKNDFGIAQRLAQRDYDLQIIKLAQRRVSLIKSFVNNYRKTRLSKVYEKSNAYRKLLINAVELPDDEYIKKWQAAEYKGKEFGEDAAEIITERGERVRSKSEKIIADKLFSLGVPYRYECPLILEGNVKIYPDFTILKMPEREEVYLEHFGMLDDLDYVNSMLFKLKTYEKNGIYLGLNLLITHETSREPLNTRVLDGFVKNLWCNR